MTLRSRRRRQPQHPRMAMMDFMRSITVEAVEAEADPRVKAEVDSGAEEDREATTVDEDAVVAVVENSAVAHEAATAEGASRNSFGLLYQSAEHMERADRLGSPSLLVSLFAVLSHIGHLSGKKALQQKVHLCTA